jgi:hypothetical protein
MRAWTKAGCQGMESAVSAMGASLRICRIYPSNGTGVYFALAGIKKTELFPKTEVLGKPLQVKIKVVKLKVRGVREVSGSSKMRSPDS